MIMNEHPRILGVLGGMGPLASAAFVQTIYGMYRGRVEQEAPVVVLYSNPGVGDRTSTFLSGGDCTPLLRDLEAGIRALLRANADKVVVCCLTMHYLVPRLPLKLRRHLISLLDTAVQEIRGSIGPCLLACTTGSRKLGLFQKHPQWPIIERRVVLPGDEEQEALHQAIYTAKRNHSTASLMHVLDSIASRHGARAIICGCTELHLVTEPYAGPNSLNQKYNLIDPLSAIARQLAGEQHDRTICA